jgi:hypothetical protein
MEDKLSAGQGRKHSHPVAVHQDGFAVGVDPVPEDDARGLGRNFEEVD